MLVLVTGGSKYRRRDVVFSSLTDFHKEHRITFLVTGGCPTGVDKYAREWADENGVDGKDYPAEWDRFGLSAGPIRNSEMLTKHHYDACIVFPGGSGTADMRKKALRARIPIHHLPRRE